MRNVFIQPTLLTNQNTIHSNHKLPAPNTIHSTQIHKSINTSNKAIPKPNDIKPKQTKSKTVTITNTQQHLTTNKPKPRNQTKQINRHTNQKTKHKELDNITTQPIPLNNTLGKHNKQQTLKSCKRHTTITNKQTKHKQTKHQANITTHLQSKPTTFYNK